MIYLFLSYYLLDNSSKLDSQSSSPTTANISNVKITPGTQNDYSHFNSKSTIQDFDLLKVKTIMLYRLLYIYSS